MSSQGAYIPLTISEEAVLRALLNGEVGIASLAGAQCHNREVGFGGANQAIDSLLERGWVTSRDDALFGGPLFGLTSSGREYIDRIQSEDPETAEED